MGEQTLKKNDLPAGWEHTILKDVCEIVLGQSPPSETYNTDGIGLPFFQGKAEFTTLHPVAAKWCSIPGKIAEQNDILLSVRAPVGDTNIADRRCCIGRGLAALRYNHYKFLFYFMRSIEEELDKKGTGSTFKAISGEIVRNTNFPLPPLPEQHRIVAKIEELFSELDKGVEALKTAQQQLKVYRQAVLQRAFEGKLTEDWRKQQKDLPTASQLLTQIKAEREKQAEAMGAKLKPTAPLTEAELNEFPKLPEGWCWVRPEDVCANEPYSIGIGPFGSNLKVSDYKPSGISLIFVRNITRNDFTSDLKYISEAKYKELIPHSVKPLDILITKMGDPPGDCAIYPEGSPIGIITSDCLKFRVWDKYCDRRYFKFCVETNLIKKQLGFITKGVAQKKISTDRFKTLCFPFASLKEQQQIVFEIESRLSVADKIEESIAQSLKQAEALRQSILKKAFSGKLVPQDLNDEPAEELLARIRAEKGEQTLVKGPSRRKGPRRKTTTSRRPP